MTDPNSDAVREHLLLESILAGTNIGIGLTAIRRYDFTDKGQFFAGMSAFTIGLERLLKLIIVIDYARTRGAFPDNAYLKDKFRHRLNDLLAEARKINERRGVPLDTSGLDDPLMAKIVRLLSTFARATRYYNLDFITGAARDTDQEPLQQWTDEVCRELVDRHHRWTAKMKEDLVFAESLARVGGVVVDHIGHDGKPTIDIAAFAHEAALAETKQKYSVLYLHRLLMFCIQLLESLDHLDGNALGVSEVFRRMWSVDRRTILNRKLWQTYR